MSSEGLIEKALMQAASGMADFDSARIERSETDEGATFYELALVAFRVFEQAQAETIVTALEEAARSLGAVETTSTDDRFSLGFDSAVDECATLIRARAAQIREGKTE